VVAVHIDGGYNDTRPSTDNVARVLLLTTTACAAIPMLPDPPEEKVPSTLVGRWFSTVGEGASSFTIAANGKYFDGIAVGGASRACTGVAHVDVSRIRLEAKSKDCASRTVTWSLDENVLTLDGSELFREDVQADSASCLLGPWYLSNAYQDIPAAAWDSDATGTVRVEYSDYSNNGDSRLRFGSDGVATAVEDIVYAMQPATNKIAMANNGKATTRYSVSGHTISYSGENGLFTWKFFADGSQVNSETEAATFPPDSFTCTKLQLSLSGAHYHQEYRRGNGKR